MSVGGERSNREKPQLYNEIRSSKPDIYSGGAQDGQPKSSTRQISLHLPHCFHSEVSSKGDVWKVEAGCCGSHKQGLQNGECHDLESSNNARLCAYVCIDTAKRDRFINNRNNQR